jgi:hypothetical protein
MKILGRLIKRIEIIAFVLGFVAGIYMLIFFPVKYFSWHALPAPPEPVVKIVSANHMGDIIIITASKKKFICNLDSEKECWTEIDYEPLTFGKVLCFMQDCPDNHTMQIIKATGQFHNFGEISFIYSLLDDGIIYVKQTGFIYLPGYMMGAIIGGVCALIAFIAKYLFLRISSFFRRDPIK